MATPPEGTDGLSSPVNSARLAAALASSSKSKSKSKGHIMDDDFKEAFFDMTESFKAIGQTAKQNNTQFWQRYHIMVSLHLLTKIRVSFLLLSQIDF